MAAVDSSIFASRAVLARGGHGSGPSSLTLGVEVRAGGERRPQAVLMAEHGRAWRSREGFD